MELGDRKTVTVGENTYHIMPFPPFTAARNLGTLQTYLLPIFGKLASGVAGDPKLMEKDTDKKDDLLSILTSLDDAVQEISKRLDGAAIEKLLTLLLNPEFISVDDPSTGKVVRLTEPVVNRLFIGKTTEMMLLAVKVVQVNYADFFTILGSHFGSPTE